MKDLDSKRKKEYEAYLNSDQAKLERFLDSLDDERRKYEANTSKSFGKWNFKKLARRAYNG